jgi:clan AA aspartic protease (TIGR02281 family)
LEIRFRLCDPGHLILVKILVNDAGPFDFILDTGASMTVLSPASASAAGIGKGGLKAKALAAKGSLDARVVRLRSLQIGSLTVRGLSAAVVRLETLHDSLGVKVDGIVGYNLLRRYRLTIDYPKRRLWLESSSSRAERH